MEPTRARPGPSRAVSITPLVPDPGADTVFIPRFTLLVAVILSGAIPVLLLVLIPDARHSAGWPLTLLVLIWSGVRLAWVLGAGRRRLFQFSWWLFTYIFMGLAPTVQLRSGLLPSTTPGIDERYDLPALVAVLGVAAFEVGSRLAHLYRQPSLAVAVKQTVHAGRALLVAYLGASLCLFRPNAPARGAEGGMRS